MAMEVQIKTTMADIQKTVDEIKKKTDIIPEIGLILGSGLGEMADTIENAVTIPYSELFGFQTSTVKGHGNTLVIGTLKGKNVVCMKGRYHYYEGFSMFDVTYPARVIKALGATKLIVTNAAGTVNRFFQPGDLMCIEDHINLMGNNPMRGQPEEYGTKFIDMTYAYSPKLKDLAYKTALELGVSMKGGVYLANIGPSYETPAEVRMAKAMGADAVGMSTVPEVIVANQVGLEVLGISCITNLAAGISPEPLSHAEVVETGNRVKNDFIKLIKAIIEKM